MKQTATPPKASKPADPSQKAADTGRTSDLSFAVRHCDVPYLDHLENQRYELSCSAADPDSATFVA